MRTGTGEPIVVFVGTADLGSLLNLTAFNPSSSWATDVKIMLLNYAGNLKTQFNDASPGSAALTNPSQQLAM